MVQQISSQNIIYPDSDGQPMADNTKQFRWIVTIKENLEILFANNPDVFIAGDLLWYPVSGNNKIRKAPDVMVIFGRPKGDRGFYKQWEEENIAPQVVFEILSPGNTFKEMLEKLQFYQEYGVQEYYIYDPDKIELTGLENKNNRLEIIDPINNWISPLLKIKFEVTTETLKIYYPDGRKFMTTLELEEIRKKERERAEQAMQQLQQQQEKYNLLLQKLKDKGINLEDLQT